MQANQRWAVWKEQIWVTRLVGHETEDSLQLLSRSELKVHTFPLGHRHGA